MKTIRKTREKGSFSLKKDRKRLFIKVVNCYWKCLDQGVLVRHFKMCLDTVKKENDCGFDCILILKRKERRRNFSLSFFYCLHTPHGQITKGIYVSNQVFSTKYVTFVKSCYVAKCTSFVLFNSIDTVS